VPSPASATIPDAVTSPPSDPLSEPKPRGPTPTDRLAVQIGRARLFLYEQAVRAEDAANRTADGAFALERSLTETVASLAPPRESGERLMPGVVYVLVASMAGTIISRNRNILLRAATPLAFGIGAGWALLPITMGNVSDLLWTYEQRVPALADAHLRTRAAIERSLHFARAHADVGKTYVDEKVGNARDLMEDWVKKGK
jgi:MICOS complex subunit MIC26